MIDSLFQLGPGNGEGAARAQWRGQGPRHGHCAPRGTMRSSPLSPARPSACLPTGSASQDSWLSSPTAVTPAAE